MLTFSFSYFLEVWPKLLEAVPYTFYFILMSTLVSFVAGILVAMVRIPRIPVLFELTELWMSLIRSMPFVLLLFLSYFLLPFLLQGFGIASSDVPKEIYVYAAMFMHYGPIVAEVIRPA